MTDFADKLMKALRDSGYRHFSFIPMQEISEKYEGKNISPKMMADKIAEEYNLAMIEKLYNLLKSIENEDKFSVKRFSKAHNLSYFLLSSALKAYSPIEISGQKAGTTYKWVSKESVSSVHAEHLLSIMDEMKNYELSDKLRNAVGKYIKQSETVEQVLSHEGIPVFARYKILSFYNYTKKVQSTHKVSKEIVTEARFTKPRVKEIKQELDELISEQPIQEPVEKSTPEIEIEILKAEISYLKAINKLQKKLIKKLKRIGSN